MAGTRTRKHHTEQGKEKLPKLVKILELISWQTQPDESAKEKRSIAESELVVHRPRHPEIKDAMVQRKGGA